MCAMMYRHRPSMPALIAALAVFIGGAICLLRMKALLAAGEVESSSLMRVFCVVNILGGALLVVAFARYQYTHLWKSTGAVHSDKYKRRPRKKRQTK